MDGGYYIDKCYQIFVSSTFSDLKEERKAIIEGLLNAKYIPAGMEMFAASNDDPYNLPIDKRDDDNPQIGWTRGNIEDSVELLSQINDLRKEKESIEKEYRELKEKK